MPPSPNPSPATPPVPPEAVNALVEAITPKLEQLVATKATQAAEAAIASRPNNPVQAQPTTSGAVDLEVDPPKGSERYARLGVQIKAQYVQRAEKLEQMHRPGMDKLKKYVERCKAVGVFAGIFEQGGALYARETRSAEVIEFLRADSILLAAGAREMSGYGGKLTIGRINSGVTVEWVGEGEPAEDSDMGTGTLELGAHKYKAKAKVSNDVMRLGNVGASADIGQDMTQAVGLEVDVVGLYGAGAKKPLGAFNQVPVGNKNAITGSSVDNIRSDLKLKLIKPVTDSKLKLANNNPFYFMTMGVLLYLSELRDSAGYVYPTLQNFERPTLNGFPVSTTESLQGKQQIGFGLARQLYFGNASPLEITLGETGDDFGNDMMTVKGVGHVDWGLRHKAAFAFLTGVTYGA